MTPRRAYRSACSSGRSFARRRTPYASCLTGSFASSPQRTFAAVHGHHQPAYIIAMIEACVSWLWIIVSEVPCCGRPRRAYPEANERDPLLGSHRTSIPRYSSVSRLPSSAAPKSSDIAQQKRNFAFEELSAVVVGHDFPWGAPSMDTGLDQIYLSRQKLMGALSVDERAYGTDIQERRRNIWGVTQIARSGVVNDTRLFRSPLRGNAFTIRPTIRSRIPLQWVHVAPGVISHSLADLPCASMPSEVLLHHLNDILGTSHKLTTDGMRSLLKEIRATSHDFGEAYGKVRQWWTIPHLDGVHGLVYYTSLYRREATREARRRHAVESSSLSSSYMPPRRIWDLHSNRVVPLGVILGDDYGDTFDVLPDQLWTISHSWVADAERKMVWTTINNKRWPVPIPRATSLEHIRVELLNMGAEYVWLDVLCLRQQGREEDEDRRIEEWKIDVPTIGYIYRGNPRSRPCVTYFNGLGLPLTTGLSALSSDRHWFNRVWTLQESLTTWLPGGLTGEALPAGTEFFSRLEGLARLVAVEDQNDHLVSELIRRHCAKELDRIAGLTYCFRCPTLTLYDETASVEQAWRSLLKHATSSVWRHSIFLRYAADTPFALFPSWKTYSVGDPILSPMTGCSSSELDISHVYACNMEQLHHRGYHFLSETCKISSLSPRTADDGLSPATLRLHFPSKSRSVVVTPVDIHGALLSTAFYRIVRICSIPYQFWVIVEDVSEPLPHSFDQQRKLPTVSARPVIKWAVLQISEHDEDRLSAFVTDDQEVVYLSEAESLKKTKHGRKYLQMFQHMKETGRTYMSRFA